MLLMPLVFLAAALPIVSRIWAPARRRGCCFFPATRPTARILAYSLAAHFIFMFCNGVIGLLPRASRELTALGTG